MIKMVTGFYFLDGMNMNHLYQTKDFNEASLLLANRLKLVSVQRDGPCYFNFEGYDNAMQLTEAFWRGDLMGNIREFVDAQRRVKDLIHRDN
jgi:hypothetical protein